jgi:hypothetical protein
MVLCYLEIQRKRKLFLGHLQEIVAFLIAEICFYVPFYPPTSVILD